MRCLSLGSRVYFLVAVAKYLLSGHLFGFLARRSRTGHVVPEGFAGVGVAAADDPVVDDYIISRLNDIGIKRVRLDFSYGDASSPTGRLLRRLCDSSSFKVLLHIVQPFESASRMLDKNEQETWRRFVADTLDAYGSQVHIVEIGSTINRKRWAGYSLAGFLSMWAIAHHEVRSRGVVLAGPNITDFEPVFNIGILSLLRKYRQLPDIHTDNLFSERCTEPERYDHKVFGRLLAPVAKVNLLRKAFVLQGIGERLGVPKLLSPAAFWTLPRIERMLPDSEQKQADYLARYMVLCAASGLLEGAWWGPLICHREGLVDDGVRKYPVLERITHYRSVTGSLADFRARPAFDALRAFNRLIPRAFYLGRLSSSEGLEIHAFKHSDKLLHVVWTINGCAAALVDIYDAEVLDNTLFLGRDGESLHDRPTLATESPMYLCWTNGRTVTIREGARILAGVRVHSHSFAKQAFFFRERGFRGIVMADGHDDAARVFRALCPDQLTKPS